MKKYRENSLTYANRVENPVPILMEPFSTALVLVELIIELIKTHGFKTSNFKKVASYRHFGRNDLGLPWENQKN